MTQLRERLNHSLLIQTLSPSLGGSVSALIFAVIALVAGRLSGLSAKLNALYIPQAFSSIERGTWQTITGLLHNSLHGYADNLLLVLFWALIGIGAYCLVHGLGNIFLDFEESLEERNYLWPAATDHNKVLVTFLTRLGFRSATLIVLLVYIFAIAPKIFNALDQMLNVNRPRLTMTVYYLVFLMAAWLVAQAFIVLVRLTALRTRLF